MIEQNELVEQEHWNEMASDSLSSLSIPVWRGFCDELYLRSLNSWIGERRFRAALKTDLFDEVVGDGLAAWLQSVSDRVEGFDLVPAIAQEAASRHPQLITRQSDVRRLGSYPADYFDLVVSNSTLDHFTDEADLAKSLAELTRVLMPGGLLFVSLDNPQNPIVSVRNRLSRMSKKSNPLIPYFMGYTVSQVELCRMLDVVGLSVERTEHVMHAPRVLFLHACQLFSHDSWSGKAMIKWMLAFEVLKYLPTRSRTGHYSVVLARKPDR